LEAGARPDLKDSDDRRPIDLARAEIEYRHDRAPFEAVVALL
jgi:hypothetical protein